MSTGGDLLELDVEILVSKIAGEPFCDGRLIVRDRGDFYEGAMEGEELVGFRLGEDAIVC